MEDPRSTNQYSAPFIQQERRTVADRSGVGIPCRVWEAASSRGTVILIHGLQSHSGWFTEPAAWLAEKGYGCCAFDRRGSGLSEAARGHLETYHDLVEELRCVVDHVKGAHPGLAVHLLSLCFGAKVACAFLTQYGCVVDSAIFLSPGVFTKVTLSRKDRFRVLLSGKGPAGPRLPTPLKDHLFTEIPEYLQFIQSDSLGLRRATAGMYFQVALMNRRIRSWAAQISAPALFLLAGNDPIVDNEKTIAFFQQLRSDPKELISYANARHSLLFSSERQRVLDDILRWLGRFS